MKKIIFITTLFLYFQIVAQNQNISNGNVFDGEPYLAINPDNSQHLVVAWMGWVNVIEKVKIKVKISFDGGQTWSNTTVLPHITNGYTSADPAISFAPNGKIFISYIDFTGFNTSPLNGGIYLSRSDDGGINWNAPTEVLTINADPDRLPIDRPWIAIDNSGGANQGTIYITSMNVKNALPDYHPYVSISTDGGDTFNWKNLDAEDWLSGNFIPQPMPTPTLNSSGVFYAVYPSFVLSQNTSPQFILASSSDGGETFEYHSVFESTNSPNDDLAKKGYLLLSNPADLEHLAFFYLDEINGDIDVNMVESFNAGVSWSNSIRINDDPIGNGKMQDLLWADFDNEGNLIISWRDRRNGSSNTYETASEIWAAYKDKDWNGFSENFKIADQLVAYDEVLGNSGNDFMGIKLQDNIIHAVWGDPRDGKLNIWYQKMSTDGIILSIQQIGSEELPSLIVHPNPVNDEIIIEGVSITKLKLIDSSGKIVYKAEDNNFNNLIHLNISNYSSGNYFLVVIVDGVQIVKKIVKN